MKILVANLGTTSFKYRLFDMTDERQLRAAASNGSARREVRCFVETAASAEEATVAATDHAAAVRQCLEQLDRSEAGLPDRSGGVAAIGFKAVHAGRQRRAARR